MPPKQKQPGLQKPLNQILGTESNVRILRVLAGTDVPVGAGELAKRAGLGRTSIYPTLEALEKTGILELVGAGRQRQIQFRRKHPFASPIIKLFYAESSHFENIILAMRRVLESIGPAIISAWIEGPSGHEEDPVSDSIRLSILSDPRSIPDIGDFLSLSLGKVEEQFDVQVRVKLLTRSELASPNRTVLSKLRDAILVIGIPPTAFVESTSTRSRRNYLAHSDHDMISRRLGVAVAAKLRHDPGLISVALRHLSKRAKIASPQERRELNEWKRRLITMSPSRLQRFLVEPGEDAERLRQSLPSLDLLTPAERQAAVESRTDDEARSAVLQFGRRQRLPH